MNAQNQDFQGTHRNGFSLLEIVTAVAMFTVMVVALLAIFTNGYLHARQMRMASKAYLYAQQLMEQYSNASSVFPAPANESDNFTDPDFWYDLNFSCPPVTEGALSTHDHMVEINATVYWLGKRQQQRSFSLVTYIADIGG